MLNKNTQKLLDEMKKIYRESGYLYSGCIHPDEIEQLFGRRDVGLAVAEELKTEGYIQVRDCQGTAYELVPRERAALIHDCHLDLVWELKAPYCYPNSDDGEVTAVMREAKAA